MDDFPREKLCPCRLCQFSYEVVDFVEMLIDERARDGIDAAVGDAEDPDRPRPADIRALRCDVLINAAAEYLFKEGGNPEHFMEQFVKAWNNRASRVMSGEDRSEVEKRLDEYKS